MKSLRTRMVLLAAAALSAGALSAHAQEAPAAPAAAGAGSTVYNIELIVFRATGAQGSPENWSTQGASARNIAGDETATGNSQVGHFVGVLPSSTYQLAELENRMRASGAYVPVAHVAWSQTASSWGTRAGFRCRAWVWMSRPDGHRVPRARQFLHLGMTLNYAMPSPPRAERATGYRVQHQREPTREVLRSQLLRPPGLWRHCAGDARPGRKASGTLRRTRRAQAPGDGSPRWRRHQTSSARVNSQVAPPRSSRAQRTRSREAAMNQVSCKRGLPRPKAAGVRTAAQPAWRGSRTDS